MQRPPCFCLSLVEKGGKYSQPISEECDNLEKSRPTSCVYCLLAIGDSWRRGALSRHCSWCLFIISAWRTLNIEEHCVVNVQTLQLMLVYFFGFRDPATCSASVTRYWVLLLFVCLLWKCCSAYSVTRHRGSLHDLFFFIVHQLERSCKPDDNDVQTQL